MHWGNGEWEEVWGPRGIRSTDDNNMFCGYIIVDRKD